MTTFQSTVLEKLFQEDQPIGGSGIATGVAALSFAGFGDVCFAAWAEMYVELQSNSKTENLAAMEETRVTATVHIIRG
jgi:hypothetical protein